MAFSDGISDPDRKKIIGLVKLLFPDAKIYLYGSRARGDHRPQSDIDIAIDTGKKLALHDLGELRSILEAAYIPYKIEIVDLLSLHGDMKSNVEKDKILWND